MYPTNLYNMPYNYSSNEIFNLGFSSVQIETEKQILRVINKLLLIIKSRGLDMSLGAMHFCTKIEETRKTDFKQAIKYYNDLMQELYYIIDKNYSKDKIDIIRREISDNLSHPTPGKLPSKIDKIIEDMNNDLLASKIKQSLPLPVNKNTPMPSTIPTTATPATAAAPTKATTPATAAAPTTPATAAAPTTATTSASTVSSRQYPPPLNNLGNTCYANSIFWLLSRLNWKNDLFSLAARDNSNSNTTSFYNLMNAMQFENNDILTSLTKFFTDFTDIATKKKFSLHEQQDPHEFFLLLLEYLQPTQTTNPKWLSRLEFDENKTLTCSNPSYTKETNLNKSNHLSLALDTTTKSLDSLLTKYTLLEKLDSNIAADSTHKECPKNNASNQINIQNLGEFVIVHLKRFDQQNKIISNVDIPVSFDFGKYTKEKTSKMYNLIAFNAHIGSSVKSGHYVAFLNIDEKWYKYDVFRNPLW